MEVTTVTTGKVPDADGYDVYNDPWDYDDDSNGSVPVTINGMVVLSLRPGDHNIGLAGVAPNCGGKDLDRVVRVAARDTVTKIEFEVVCSDTTGWNY